MLNRFLVLIFTIKDLKLIQIFFYIVFLFRKKKFIKKKLKFNKKNRIKKKPFFLKKANYFNLKKKKYNFGNVSRKINLINWNYNAPNALWEYNLFYFDFLFQKNFLNNQKFSVSLINKWIKISYKKTNHVMWDPYPTSLRLINLIKFCDILFIIK